ncbi:hypothetical protein Bhyg_07643 [Pseudolycoriella hygida]|uniref:Uncharacterized protein n=1 Tax=Pseudolycoriella hygida TaxID=35572 RepID=A0A9Q0S460_9DIPT|nr:hypothetical protein Bhyg_07643 [Pseudolycoriella hygida]
MNSKSEPTMEIPVSEENFKGWDEGLKNREAFSIMKSFYENINLKETKAFLKACIKSFYENINLKETKAFLKACIVKTFAKTFISKINFTPGNPMNQSNILVCLIEKFKERNYDDGEARKEVIKAFRRFRDAKHGTQ